MPHNAYRVAAAWLTEGTTWRTGCRDVPQLWDSAPGVPSAAFDVSDVPITERNIGDWLFERDPGTGIFRSILCILGFDPLPQDTPQLLAVRNSTTVSPSSVQVVRATHMLRLPACAPPRPDIPRRTAVHGTRLCADAVLR